MRLYCRYAKYTMNIVGYENIYLHKKRSGELSTRTTDVMLAASKATARRFGMRRGKKGSNGMYNKSLEDFQVWLIHATAILVKLVGATIPSPFCSKKRFVSLIKNQANYYVQTPE